VWGRGELREILLMMRGQSEEGVIKVRHANMEKIIGLHEASDLYQTSYTSNIFICIKVVEAEPKTFMVQVGDNVETISVDCLNPT